MQPFKFHGLHPHIFQVIQRDKKLIEICSLCGRDAIVLKAGLMAEEKVFKGLAAAYTGGESKPDLKSVWMPHIQPEGNVENLEMEVDRVLESEVKVLMCYECGFSVVGHTCRIPGACDSFKSSPLDGGE